MGIRAAWRWFAVILPPAWLVVLSLGVLIVLSLLLDFARNQPGFRRPDPDPLLILTCALAVGWGFYRGAWLNPMLASPYRAWLTQTPWKRGRRLPFGPVLPAGQDLVALLALYAWSLALQLQNPAAPCMAYGVAWCIAACAALAATHEVFGFAAAFALPTMILLKDSPPLQAAALSTATIAALIGLWRSLGRFPWPDCKALVEVVQASQQSAIATSLLISGGEVRRELLGWPFASLGPLGSEAEAFAVGKKRRATIDSLLSWLLIAWTYRCVGSGIPAGDRDPIMIAAYSMLCTACVLFRFALIFVTCMPPLSIPGQFATGRLVIPSYHRMLLTPIGTLLASVLAPLALRNLGMPLEIALPIALFAVFAAQSLLGPELHRWRLTCAYRVTQPFLHSEAATVVQVK